MGNHLAWLEEAAAAASVKSELERIRAKGLVLRIATTAVGVQDLGDLTPATTAETIRHAMGQRFSVIVRVILNAQQARYGPAACPSLADWGFLLAII